MSRSELDPRLAVVDRRLAGVGRILAVTGGKGGIGKSSVASVLALLMAEAGLRTGLLDLDLTSPSDHLILGLGDRAPTEEFGLEPARVHGVQLMTVSYFLGDEPIPLRGPDWSSALLEILAITHWDDPDVLVIDMPPGLGDVALDLARWLRRAEYLVVAGSSRVVLGTVRRTLGLLREQGAAVAGVVENLRRDETTAVPVLARELGARFLGALPFDPGLEAALGAGPALLETRFARALRGVRDVLLGGERSD